MEVGDKVQFRFLGNKKFDNKFGVIQAVLSEDMVLVDVGGKTISAYKSQLQIKTKEELDEWRRKRAAGEFNRKHK